MAIANSEVQALVTRIDKLEKQNRRFKQLASAALILPALLLLVLLISVAAPTQAPTHQASAPTQKEWESATPMTPAQAPTHQASAPKPASAAERISALESKVKALSERLATLQKNIPMLLAARSLSEIMRDQNAIVIELQGHVVELQSHVADLERNVRELQGEVAGLVSDGDSAHRSLLSLEVDVDNLNTFRHAVCSAFKFSDRPAGCSAF